jgi:endonuclease/exonuclease/phosphatase family metal-dependent hydrolase
MAMLLCTILLWWAKRSWVIACTVLLLAGLPLLLPSFALQQGGWQTKKQTGALRIMQWNCMGLVGSYFGFASQVEKRKEIVEFVRAQQPDVILIQDFSTYKGPSLWSNIALLRDTLGYTNMHFVYHGYYEWPWGRQWDGTLICSKHPFTQKNGMLYTGRQYPEYIVWADMQWKGKTMRFVSTHFQSMNLNTKKGEPKMLTPVQYEDSNIIRSGDIWKKMAYYMPYHAGQATQLRTFIDSSSAPVVCGIDMNSVPSSWNYMTVKGKMQDAHLEKGYGPGRSFESRLPQLRIDFLFADQQLKVIQCHTFPVSFSDHYPVLADIDWR